VTFLSGARRIRGGGSERYGVASDQADGPEAGERLEWTVWPAAQRPALSIAVAIFCLLLAALAIWAFGSPWYGFIALLVLALTLAPHFVPTTYQLGDEKALTRGGSGNVERSWEAFRLALDLGDRIVLSPLSDADRWLARRRSVTLRLAGNRDEVLAFVARHVPVK
jgi:hypothetical protein